MYALQKTWSTGIVKQINFSFWIHEINISFLTYLQWSNLCRCVLKQQNWRITAVCPYTSLILYSKIDKITCVIYQSKYKIEMKFPWICNQNRKFMIRDQTIGYTFDLVELLAKWRRLTNTIHPVLTTHLDFRFVDFVLADKCCLVGLQFVALL